MIICVTLIAASCTYWSPCMCCPNSPGIHLYTYSRCFYLFLWFISNIHLSWFEPVRFYLWSCDSWLLIIRFIWILGGGGVGCEWRELRLPLYVYRVQQQRTDTCWAYLTYKIIWANDNRSCLKILINTHYLMTLFIYLKFYDALCACVERFSSGR